MGYTLAHRCNTVFTIGLFLQVSPPPPVGCIISSSSRAPSTAPFSPLTFDFTHLHLLHHSSVVFLLCWPLVHVQVSVGWPRIQYDPILWAKQSHHCTRGTEPDTAGAGLHTQGDQKWAASLAAVRTCCVFTLLSSASVQSFHQRIQEQRSSKIGTDYLGDDPMWSHICFYCEDVKWDVEVHRPRKRG